MRDLFNADQVTVADRVMRHLVPGGRAPQVAHEGTVSDARSGDPTHALTTAGRRAGC